MTTPRRKFLQIAAGAATLPMASRLARAQAFPTRPITLVVSFPAGGPADAVARIVVERLRLALGQPVVIENVAGANGSIGTGRVARALPDGYTLSLGVWNSHVANGAAYTLQYNVVSDFEPVALLANYAQLIVGKKDIPADDLRGLIAWLKANPDKASQGHPGVGSQGHLGGIFFQKLTDTRFQHVPYRGLTFAMQDLVGGQIDLVFPDPASALPLVRAGRIKAFAVAARTRSAAAPEIPTVDEAGLPRFYVSNWVALFAPIGTPTEIIERLNEGTVVTLADPVTRQKLADIGFEIPPRNQQTPAALAAFQKAEIEKWWPVIKAANIKGE
ncbi:MAG TPA: tripartite tricarboxylate transporter substrate-binding protein [Xanthobacteraceae bacterium]|jgi:tripartite-type tricarboxylate transporter receptor subunit TctC|nr:tripartite tricarboxylate transporter substrate-binding protein [Xanthobacteraceae bacterium]